jgi:uncharacterized paraquat-inducible protein A
MTIKCTACQSVTVADDAVTCFKCGRKFRDQDRIPLRLFVIAALIGVSLPLVFVVIKMNYSHVLYFLALFQR